VRRVSEVIVVLRVLTSLFFLTSSSGAVVSRAQVCRTAGLRADGAERHQPPHVVRPTRRTRGWMATCALEVLKLLLTLEALILKNGH
jgi:hypothetical protein